LTLHLRCNNICYYSERNKMISLKLVQIGNSVGFVLPKEAASKLKVEKGDIVFLTESPDGYRISPYDPAFEKQMQAAERIMKKRRDVLRALAK
jgi:putative addiction module antidote